MRLIPQPPGRISAGQILFEGQDLLALSEAQMRSVRGNRIAMIFQEPMSSLNPSLTVGLQVAEPINVHRKVPWPAAFKAARSLLERVQIPDAESRLHTYPHQYSGGMRQRAMIAIALACNPKLIIADEPTTALDVTVQAQILDLLKELTRETGAALILITHDLGVVARYADRVVVMYAGRVVEQAPARGVVPGAAAPLHARLAGLGAAPGRRGRRAAGADRRRAARPGRAAAGLRLRTALHARAGQLPRHPPAAARCRQRRVAGPPPRLPAR